jgi:hypothetical protein
VDEFAMMTEMGFFFLTGQRYQMAIPTRLNMEKIKMAALKLAQTEDKECYLHPEYLVATMPKTEAEAWQRRRPGRVARCLSRLANLLSGLLQASRLSFLVLIDLEITREFRLWKIGFSVWS